MTCYISWEYNPQAAPEGAFGLLSLTVTLKSYLAIVAMDTL
jgi:hypothetical protein